MAQSFNVGVSGAWKAAKPYVGVSGAWKPVQTAWVGVGGVWKQFYAAMTAAITGTPGWGAPDPESGLYASQTQTCTPTGGTAPYTYAWSATDPNASSIGSGSTTQFISTTGASTAIACLVTDANGATATATGSI